MYAHYEKMLITITKKNLIVILLNNLSVRVKVNIKTNFIDKNNIELYVKVYEDLRNIYYYFIVKVVDDVD